MAIGTRRVERTPDGKIDSLSGVSRAENANGFRLDGVYHNGRYSDTPHAHVHNIRCYILYFFKLTLEIPQNARAHFHRKQISTVILFRERGVCVCVCVCQI